MIETIQTRLFDILEADTRLLTGGFSGVKRCKNGTDFGGTDPTQNPAGNFVNLFDWTFEMNDNQMRPGVYFGYKNDEFTDKQDANVVAMNLLEYRVVTGPIVIVYDNTSRYLARRLRSQLRTNILQILKSSTNIANDLWWILSTDQANKANSIPSGGGVNNVSQSISLLYIDCHYKLNRGDLRP